METRLALADAGVSAASTEQKAWFDYYVRQGESTERVFSKFQAWYGYSVAIACWTQTVSGIGCAESEGGDTAGITKALLPDAAHNAQDSATVAQCSPSDCSHSHATAESTGSGSGSAEAAVSGSAAVAAGWEGWCEADALNASLPCAAVVSVTSSSAAQSAASCERSSSGSSGTAAAASTTGRLLLSKPPPHPPSSTSTTLHPPPTATPPQLVITSSSAAQSAANCKRSRSGSSGTQRQWQRHRQSNSSKALLWQQVGGAGVQITHST